MPASSEDRYLNSYPMRYQGYHQDCGTATKNYQGLQDHNQDWQAYHSANYHRYRDVNQDRHNCFD
ncbi:hypothetical protein FSOLCH5_003471 [Fusarium solani]